MSAVESLIRPARSILAQAGAARIERSASVKLSNVSFAEETEVLSATAEGTRTKEGTPLYLLRMDPGGWICDCPDFIRRGGACKHVTKLALTALAGGFPTSSVKTARLAFLSIRRACHKVVDFDQQCLDLVRGFAAGRNVTAQDFVRAARMVALQNGKEI